jgi:hypothetical protein
VTLAEQLNKFECSVQPGRKPELEVCPTDDSLFDESGAVVDSELSVFLDRVAAFEVFFDVCPFDRRLGVVAHVAHNGQTAWYRDSECAWVDG